MDMEWYKFIHKPTSTQIQHKQNINLLMLNL
jgi:hypothetical protein